jgi:hypothetical protein
VQHALSSSKGSEIKRKEIFPGASTSKAEQVDNREGHERHTGQQSRLMMGINNELAESVKAMQVA